MALTEITKVTGPGIHTLSNILSHNINSSGIITATKFVGPIEGSITSTDASFTGNVSIGGTLTYEDVKNVDAVGIITAREGIFIPDNKEVKIGNTASNPDIKIFHQSSSNHSFIDNTTGNLYIRGGGQVISLQATNVSHSVQCNPNSWVKLYNAGSEKLSTTSKGITVGTGVTIETNGQATFVGVVTFGSGSTTIDDNVVNVGTALTLGHTQGLQFHTQNLHAQGFEVNQINATGVITATSFSGSGANLTGLASREVYGFTGIGKSLSLTTTNSGADNIDNATYVAFEESFIGPSGLSFSINTSGNLIMTV